MIYTSTLSIGYWVHLYRFSKKYTYMCTVICFAYEDLKKKPLFLCCAVAGQRPQTREMWVFSFFNLFFSFINTRVGNSLCPPRKSNLSQWITVKKTGKQLYPSPPQYLISNTNLLIFLKMNASKKHLNSALFGIWTDHTQLHEG